MLTASELYHWLLNGMTGCLDMLAGMAKRNAMNADQQKRLRDHRDKINEILHTLERHDTNGQGEAGK